jgi:hypothetical protein
MANNPFPNTGNLSSKEKVAECKKINKLLWKCIEKNNYTIKYCGKHFYSFYKCFNSIDY